MDGLEAAEKLYGAPSSGDGAPDPDRVPLDRNAGFFELRGRCLNAARRYGSPYARLLRTLRGVEPLPRHRAEEERGASYKRLCKAAHAAELSKRERKNLYWIAEQIGMSDRFAGHILASLEQDEGGPSGGGV